MEPDTFDALVADNTAVNEISTDAGLLPNNATALERAMEALTHRLELIPIDIHKLTSIEDCPAHLLAYLSWDVSLDTWYVADNKLTTEALRDAMALNASVHQAKGSVASIISAIEIMGFDYSLKEWWQTDSQYKTPFHFEISMNAKDKLGRGYTKSIDARLKSIINKIKPVRTRYLIELHTQFSNTLHVASQLKKSQQARFNFHLNLKTISLTFSSTLNVTGKLNQLQSLSCHLHLSLPDQRLCFSRAVSILTHLRQAKVLTPNLRIALPRI